MRLADVELDEAGRARIHDALEAAARAMDAKLLVVKITHCHHRVELIEGNPDAADFRRTWTVGPQLRIAARLQGLMTFWARKDTADIVDGVPGSTVRVHVAKASLGTARELESDEPVESAPVQAS